MSKINKLLEIIDMIFKDLEMNLDELKLIFKVNHDNLDWDLINFIIESTKSPFKEIKKELEKGNNIKILENIILSSVESDSNNFSKKQFFNLNDSTINFNKNFLTNQFKIECDPKTEKINISTEKIKHKLNFDLKRKRRGKYHKIEKKIKLEALELCKKHSPQFVSQLLNLDIKNLKRWILKGVNKKNKVGRKVLDPIMEKNLFEFIKDYFELNKNIPEYETIKDKAILLTKYSKFKASITWFGNFISRYSKKIKKLKNNNLEDSLSVIDTNEFNKNYLDIFKN